MPAQEIDDHHRSQQDESGPSQDDMTTTDEEPDAGCGGRGQEDASKVMMADFQHLDDSQLFDRLIEDVNGFGMFQKRLLLLSLIASAVASCNHLSQIFLAFTPDFLCVPPPGNATFAAADEIVSFATVKDLQGQNASDCYYQDQAGNPQECVNWVYDDTVFAQTIVTEWNLVCDRLALLPTVASSYMAGVVVINLVGGTMSDSWIGRRKTILLFSIVHVASSLLTAFSNSYIMFVAVRIFVGGSIHTVWASVFVAAMETVSESKKTLVGGVLNLGWNFGGLLLTLLSYLIRSWWKLQLAFAILSLALGAYYFLVPETPRWCFEKGRYQEAKVVLEGIARTNKTNLSGTQFYANFAEMQRRAIVREETKQKTSAGDNVSAKRNLASGANLVVDMFRSGEYARRLVLLLIPWLAVGIGSYGIHFSTKLVDLDLFMVSAIKEAVNIVVIVSCIPLFGMGYRSVSVMAAYVVSGVLAILFLVVPEENAVGRGVIFIICQSMMLAAFYMIDTYTQDVFSTDVRNSTFNLLDSIGKIGTVIAPFIVDLGSKYNSGLPPAVFGVIMVASSLVFFFTPETKDAPLLQSFREMDRYPSSKTSLVARMCERFRRSGLKGSNARRSPKTHPKSKGRTSEDDRPPDDTEEPSEEIRV